MASRAGRRSEDEQEPGQLRGHRRTASGDVRQVDVPDHDQAAARLAHEEWERVFSRRENPTDMPTCKVSPEDAPAGKILLVKLLVLAGLPPPNKEARRLIEQGAVHWDGVKQTQPGRRAQSGATLLPRRALREFLVRQRQRPRLTPQKP